MKHHYSFGKIDNFTKLKDLLTFTMHKMFSEIGMLVNWR